MCFFAQYQSQAASASSSVKVAELKDLDNLKSDFIIRCLSAEPLPVANFLRVATGTHSTVIDGKAHHIAARRLAQS